jgi:mono/diheme cytochrome c family protein
MRKATLNLIIDSAAAALLTGLVGTAYILWFALPPGTQRTHILWGLLRHEWGAVHTWIAVVLLAVLAVHVALHWRWLVNGLSRRFGVQVWADRSPRLAGVAVLAAAVLPLTILAVAAQLSVRQMDIPLHPLVDDAAAATTPFERPDTGASRIPFDDWIATFLLERCAECHGASRPAGGVRADIPAVLLQAQDGVRWVVPGRPDESRLLEVVGAPSPRIGAHRLTRSEMDALREWIVSLRE